MTIAELTDSPDVPDYSPGSIDNEIRADRNAIIDAIHDVCRWVLDTDELGMFAFRLGHEAAGCPALARYLTGKAVYAKREIEDERSFATVKVGTDEFSLGEFRWDGDGVPMCWPWSEEP